MCNQKAVFAYFTSKHILFGFSEQNGFVSSVLVISAQCKHGKWGIALLFHIIGIYYIPPLLMMIFFLHQRTRGLRYRLNILYYHEYFKYVGILHLAEHGRPEDLKTQGSKETRKLITFVTIYV